MVSSVFPDILSTTLIVLNLFSVHTGTLVSQKARYMIYLLLKAIIR